MANAAKLTDRQRLEIDDPDIDAIIAALFGDYKLPEPFNIMITTIKGGCSRFYFRDSPLSLLLDPDS